MRAGSKNSLTRARVSDMLMETSPHTRKPVYKRDYMELVDAVFEEIGHALARGENVKLSGFGTFLLREKQARQGRNPKTGEEAQISPRTVILFRPSTSFRKTLNSVPKSRRKNGAS